MHRRRIDAPPDRAREYVAAALEATDAVAAYAETEDGFRAKVGSYGVASQGYDLSVSVVGDEDGTSVVVAGEHVLFGRGSRAPTPEAFVGLVAAHLDRAVVNEATATATKRVASPGDLDGLTLPSGRTVPLYAPFGLVVLFVAGYLAALTMGPTMAPVVASTTGAVVTLLAVLVSWLRLRSLQRQASDSPDSTAR